MAKKKKKNVGLEVEGWGTILKILAVSKQTYNSNGKAQRDFEKNQQVENELQTGTGEVKE